MNLVRELEVLSAESRSQMALDTAYSFLPEIVETLEQLRVAVSEEEEVRVQRLLSGLGRLVTEDFSFSESDLGGKLLDLVTNLTTRKG